MLGAANTLPGFRWISRSPGVIPAQAEYRNTVDSSRASGHVKIALPADGLIRVESAILFTEADSPYCKRFLERVFLAPEIRSAAIIPRDKPSIDLLFDPARHRPRDILARLGKLLG